jgi:hypothetical protein
VHCTEAAAARERGNQRRFAAGPRVGCGPKPLAALAIATIPQRLARNEPVGNSPRLPDYAER